MTTATTTTTKTTARKKRKQTMRKQCIMVRKWSETIGKRFEMAPKRPENGPEKAELEMS